MPASNPFKKATKKQSRLRLALIGPPGSGKTYSALRVGTALARKVALIDTEFRSASKYADLFGFDVLNLEGSFHPQRYLEAIHAAEEAGYEVVVIDSLSHAWIGKDGGLDLHDQAVARQKSKNAFTAWAEVTPHHRALVTALVQCQCHLIVTLRSKVEYVQDKDSQGRTTVRKVGLAPLMRDGLEYEFDLAGDMDETNTLIISKSRCPALKRAVIAEPGEALAQQLLAWLGAGSADEPEPVIAQGEGKRDAVLTGAALLQRIRSKDDLLAREKLCPAGALLAAVRQAGERKGLGRKIEEWPEEGFQLAVAETRAFEQRVRRPREPGDDTGANNG